ncbi:GntR family transcriptional regulator [Variovorax paradoxus]|uniref:FCD domain-containing protein n=1 Tax=Variovorax paradoxus TaxID=34073 RepID=A0A6I6HL47_VARPD|nr:GntR family transcriptional regulator [Variovorax paradoxus]QGW83404.1 FCD domain-containing protein [Variovorax paradoxus]
MADESEKRSLSEVIRAEIEQEIMSGRLEAGSQLDEQTLSERYGVSRTPAREALIQLAAVGLVTMRPRQGAVVTSVSLKDYVSLHEILVQLEALATRLATRRMTSTERALLEESYNQCATAAQAQDAEMYRAANHAFHETLYAASRNPILSNQIRTTRARMRGLRDMRFEHPARLRASLQEHHAILQAILTGDEEAASLAMAAHISSGGHVYADMIAHMKQ